MYPPPFVVLLMDCPASLDLAAYFNSTADTLIGVNFPLGTPWALCGEPNGELILCDPASLDRALAARPDR